MLNSSNGDRVSNFTRHDGISTSPYVPGNFFNTSVERECLHTRRRRESVKSFTDLNFIEHFTLTAQQNFTRILTGPWTNFGETRHMKLLK